MPVHLLTCLTGAGVLAGVLLGGVRGSSYLPTLPFALVECGILDGVPAALLGGLVAGLWVLVRRMRSDNE
jgi:hypothetical protein